MAYMSILLYVTYRLFVFPPPGDKKYHTLPILRDFEAEKEATQQQQSKQQDKDYWMPVCS